MSQLRKAFVDDVGDELGGRAPGDEEDPFVRGKRGGEGEEVSARYVADVDLVDHEERTVSARRRSADRERVGGGCFLTKW